jgi:hypothetical protein
VDAYCGLVGRCSWPSPAWNEAACRTSLTRDCPTGAVLATTLSAGRLVFDAAAAQTCLSGVEGLSCDTFRDRLRAQPAGLVPACAGVFRGTSIEGQACPLGIECAPGFRCVFGATCPGTCTAFAPISGACDATRWCDGQRAICLGGLCEELPATVGAPCPKGFCLAPLVCNTLGHTCQPPSLEGRPCGGDGNACFAGLACLQSSPTATGSCVRPRARTESCFEDADCDRGDGGEALVCAGGSCDLAPGPDEPCFNFRCRNAWCDSTRIPPTCLALPAQGSACALGTLCAAGLYCNAGQCAPLLGAGTACTAHMQCADGRCYGGRCVAAGDPPCPP